MAVAEKCPWCAEERDLDVLHDSHPWSEDRHYVCCDCCGARGPHESTEDSALKSWNATLMYGAVKARGR